MKMTNNDTEMLAKANTDDFTKILWKRAEPPWQTPALGRRYEEITTTVDGTGQASRATTTTKEDVVSKPSCGLTTRIYTSVTRLIHQTVYYVKKFYNRHWSSYPFSRVRVYLLDI